MSEQETIADIIAEMRALSNPISDVIIAINGRIIADRLDAALKREVATTKESLAVGNSGDCAKLREALEYPKDTNDQYIHIGDAVHMLNTDHEGDYEWDDIVLSFEYIGKGGGDVWLIHGKDGEAWACECEVLKQEGGNDGNE